MHFYYIKIAGVFKLILSFQKSESLRKSVKTIKFIKNVPVLSNKILSEK